MTKKLPLNERLNRRPIARACEFCHQKHLQCDSSESKQPIVDIIRPWYVERKRAKYLADDSKSKQTTKRRKSTISNSESANTSTDETTRTPSVSTSLPIDTKFQPILPNASISVNEGSLFTNYSQDSTPQISNQHQQHQQQQQHQQMNQALQVPPSHSHIQGYNDALNSRKTRGASPTINRLIQREPSISTSTREYSPPGDVFSSLFANEEYSQLADIIDKSGGLGNETPLSQHSHGNQSINFNSEFQSSLQNDNNTRPYISLSDNSINHNQSFSYDLVPEEDYTSPLIIRNMIQIPDDVYNVQINSYNYPKAYHALLNYLKTRFNKEQLIKIAKFMADYRPSFIAATRSLVELDLLFAERSFQRSLLEYESMSSLSSSPTIMWRRTGEIVAVSSEFSSLTSHSKFALLSKRTFIIELMNESSALDYFKLFSSVAFGDLNGVIITECTLLNPNGEPIRCASTWTVKRDVFDIPMLIVGQFLPILQVK
ncbi:hypothetical protein BN7_5116 [Wickerhamomyces ciferrii]|uniref:ERT1/acuK family PAS domain-containing protein n=1 Tax=Wickerhamomyces ciferrii (strain ATCC 14091 / BCRC 22168 / CBS 111 / JCM 3599 / NBRC 0793 / NRRL Y-1031 F-60-10) TaxID=1206466 RepID=K0KVM8_WICCF|nr:uncharacterized protein BN7_5116 [Wickerhamomyces ciferrii]CCH45534.1 hypothetical protein BN7_5116 [Wickerhamomyces ciferrii]